MMKLLLLLLDGIGDRSYAVLGRRTPLQAAHTPNLDRLAQWGSNGLYHAARPGQCFPSETAHFLLFGYELDRFPGRGLLEAVGDGVPFDTNDVLCLAHLTSVSWESGVPVLTHGRRDIKGDPREIEALYKAITTFNTGQIRFRLHQTHFNDAILVVKGPVSPYISDSDPMRAGRPLARVRALSQNPEPKESARTAEALNRYLSYCHRQLSVHDINRKHMEKGIPPANFLATLRSGRKIKQEAFYDRWGLKGMLIASAAVYGGLAHELRLTFNRVRDSGDAGDDLRERIRMGLSDPDHDFIHVHTKAPDEAGHTGDPEYKRDVISRLDAGLDELVSAVKNRDDVLVAVTADHSTPSGSALIHSGEPVPVTFAGVNVRRDEVCSFDEVSAAGGALGHLRGAELILMMLNCADRSALMGHRLGDVERPYVPTSYPPFEMT
jgi:2,3-bisphosphoglycerate-independent phosphoglycerate mutase